MIFWLSSGLDLIPLPLFLGCLCPRRYPRVGWGFWAHLSSIKTTSHLMSAKCLLVGLSEFWVLPVGILVECNPTRGVEAY